ncbi:MAG: L-lactate dehydrogenase, partial [Chloroflexota bacterium]
AYVLGEHGDSEVLTWSLVSVGGIPLGEYCRLREMDICDEARATIDEQVRKAAYSIINGKGATYYGIGSAIAQLVETILRDQRSILTVSTRHAEVAGVRDVSLSLPHLIGGQGVIETLYPKLSEAEAGELQASAQTLREAIDKLGLR